MGTSAARKAPVGRLWRNAKSFASRFAAGQEASAPRVGEVVARYIAALRESSGTQERGQGEPIMADVTRTAVHLSGFYRDWEQSGWETALARQGVNLSARPTLPEIIPALLDRLAGAGARLGEAVARAALIEHFRGFFGAEGNSHQTGVTAGVRCPEPTAGIRSFLGLAIYRKIISDLGEPLEFQAATIQRGIERQEVIRSYILGHIQALGTESEKASPFSDEEAGELLELILTRLGSRHEC